jgi:hypothetical protein
MLGLHASLFLTAQYICEPLALRSPALVNK